MCIRDSSELTLSVGGPTTGRRQVLGNVQDGTGEFANFAAGIDNQFGRKRFVSFEYSSNSTSSQAGFFSSSLAGTGVPNFNTNAIPFGIVAGGSQTTDLTNTVFLLIVGDLWVLLFQLLHHFRYQEVVVLIWKVT